MRESNPNEVAGFSTARGISDELAFACWVPYTHREKGKIIPAINAWVKRTTNKYGVTVPSSVKEAYTFDTKKWQQPLARCTG